MKNLIAALFTTILLGSTFLAANANQIEKSIKKDSLIKPFRKITVTGNVQITLIQIGKEGISYADDSFGQAKVMQQGDLITISPAGGGVAKLIVYVKDIFRITGDDNAIINTDGLLKTTYLQVFLNGNAHAEINTATLGICTILADNSKLSLSGTTKDHFMAKSVNSVLKMNSFAALKTEINRADYPFIDQEIAAVK
ncbi:hypothetical protein ACVWYG_002613 [Pedobacter sp. UYEF25]